MHLVHLSTVSGGERLLKEETMAVEVLPSPGSIIVVTVNYTVNYWTVNPTRHKQEVFRIGVGMLNQNDKTHTSL